MTQLPLCTHERIHAVCQQAEEAVVAWVDQFFQAITQLEARIQMLEDQLVRNSGNSSKPPSSGGLAKLHPRSLSRSSGKQISGQSGHPGQTLKAVAHLQRLRVHLVMAGNQCHTSLESAARVLTKNGRYLTYRRCAWK